jgi:hypothetical protein
MVKQPSALLVSRDESHVFVSSFLNDAVLRAPLSLTMGSRFGIFAQGSYCTRDLSSCAVLNGPWGLAADSEGRLFVASFGSDQVLAFSDEGEFLGAVGDSESLDSPEGLALSPDGRTLVVASFLDSRIVTFDLSRAPFFVAPPDSKKKKTKKKGTEEASGESGGVPWWTVAEGTPVDLEYMVARVEARRRREQQQQEQEAIGQFDPILDDPAAATGDSPLSLDLLHGPEDIVFLEYYFGSTSKSDRRSSSSSSSSAAAAPSGGGGGRGVSGRIAVSSHYNRSILVLDLGSGAVEEVMYGVQGALDVPMGLAVDDQADDLHHTTPTQSRLGGLGSSSSSVILCTSYSSREPGLVARFVGGAYAGVAMSSKHLAGPSAIQILSDRSVLVASYDTNAILVFNRSASAAADAERELVLRASGSMRRQQQQDVSLTTATSRARDGNGNDNPQQQQQRRRRRKQNKKRSRRRTSR